MYSLVNASARGTVNTMNFTGELALERAKTVVSAGKAIAIIFWGWQGVISIDYTEKSGCHGLFNTELVGWSDTELWKKRAHSANKAVLFHHSTNASVHTSAVVKAELVELGHKLIHRTLQILPGATSFCF